jgi:prepilin-type processing-associated H-X9-DG protein
LLPALSKARQAATNVKCQSNLRQIAMGMLMYVNDNHGYLPNFGYLTSTGTQVLYDPVGTDIYNPSNGLWTEAIHKYLDHSPRSGSPGLATTWYLSMNFLRCPAAPDFIGSDNFWTYGVNYGISNGATYGPGIFNYYQLTGNSTVYTGSRLLSRIKPTEFLLCDILRNNSATPPYAYNNRYETPDTDTDGDGILDTFSGLYSANKPYGRYNFVDFRHGSRMNYACADGSVHAVSIRDWFANTGFLWYTP